jgi:hypothetical protein
MRRWAELTSVLIGALAALVMLGGWRVPHGHGPAPANVTLSAASAKGLELSRTGPFAASSQLFAGGGSSLAGSVEVRNSSGRPLTIRARLRGDTADLDAALAIDLEAQGVVLYRGPLHGLRDWTGRSVVVGTGVSVPVTLSATIRPDSKRWQGRSVVATLELDARSMQ